MPCWAILTKNNGMLNHVGRSYELTGPVRAFPRSSLLEAGRELASQVYHRGKHCDGSACAANGGLSAVEFHSAVLVRFEIRKWRIEYRRQRNWNDGEPLGFIMLLSERSAEAPITRSQGVPESTGPYEI